jgi:hypothetical protein
MAFSSGICSQNSSTEIDASILAVKEAAEKFFANGHTSFPAQMIIQGCAQLKVEPEEESS